MGRDNTLFLSKSKRFTFNLHIKMSEPQCKKSKMSSSLEQLKALTTVVADTGDFEGNALFVNQKQISLSGYHRNRCFVFVTCYRCS